MDKKQILKQEKYLLIKNYKINCQQAILFLKREIESFKSDFANETDQLSLLRKRKLQTIQKDEWISILKNLFKEEDDKRKKAFIIKIKKLKADYQKEENIRKIELEKELLKIQNRNQNSNLS